MLSGRAAALLFLVGLGGVASTVACTSEEDAATATDNEIKDRPAREASTVLASTLLLSSGCTAAKVGPRHLLVAARCVVGHDELAAGAILEYEIAKGRTAKRREAPVDTRDASDAGAPADDAAAPVKFGPTIERVVVNESYSSKCVAPRANDPSGHLDDEKCAFGSLAASDAKDVAVIVLASDLDTRIPTIPVDLDTVRDGDTLVAVGGGCRTLDAPPRRERITRTLAVPAKASTHIGSVYEKSPALVSRLEQGYVVTPGRGWRSGDPGLCRTDIGAPLFRSGGTVAVAGITSGFTFARAEDPLPVTLHHTRVDTASEVGPWLESLGVETIHSCSGGGCVKTNVSDSVPTFAQMEAARSAPDNDTDAVDEETDAGPIADDAGDARAPRQGFEGSEVDFGDESNDGYSSSDPVYADAGRPKKTKIISACASAPGPVGGGRAFAFAAFGLALVSLARRRGGPRRG